MNPAQIVEAADFLALAGQLWRVFYFIVLPMLLLAGIGYVHQRRLKLDLRTLTQLNFYLVIPVIVYVSVITARVTSGDVLTVVIFALAMLAASALVTAVVARVRKVPPDVRNCLLMTTMFNNSGNYGLPLQDLAFRSAGLSAAATSIQAFYMVVQNAANFTVGILLAAAPRTDRHWKDNLWHIIRFPPVYALGLAIATVEVRHGLGPAAAGGVAEALRPFWDVILYVKGAFVAVALFTLGAQLAAIQRVKCAYPIKTSVVLRLLVGPLLALGLVYVLDLRGLIAQVLLIATTTPTAVNTMLLCQEFDNHPAFAARAVLYSTLLSPLTVTLAIFLAQGNFLPRLALRAGDLPAPAAAALSATQPDTTRQVSMNRRTVVAIDEQAFLINGRPTYPGRVYKGMKVEGLLMNSRMVQGIFDDLNDQTRGRWAYPDGPWDPQRNTREFVAAMPSWRAAGLLSFTLNLQGGSPEGYSNVQPWHNSAFEADGSLRGGYMARLAAILDAADGLGMAPILGLFYFGQDERLADEAAVIRATENATDWLLAAGYRNVLIEIANEINVHRYEHPILSPQRVCELIRLMQDRSRGRVDCPAGRLLVSCSMGGGGKLPPEDLVAAADFLLLHGNAVEELDRIRRMVDDCRAMPSYRGQPILFNEDDHYDFDRGDNHMLAAVSRYASWGYFDYRRQGEGFAEGYQSPPVDWAIGSARKRAFFGLLAELTGATPIA